MKRCKPSPWIPYKFNYKKLTEKLIQTIFIFLFLFLAIPSVGQNHDIRGLDEYLASLQILKSQSAETEGARLQSLVYDLHPMLFIEKGRVSNPLPGTPLNLSTDAKSFTQLYEAKPLYAGIELITINIEEPSDFSVRLDLEQLQNFPNLKYIYFLSRISICPNPDPQCEIQVIGNMIQGTHPEARLVYKVIIPN